MQPDTNRAFELLQGLWTSHIVSAIAKLGVADHLGDAGATCEETALATGCDPRSLQRLLTTAAALGILSQDQAGRFRNTPISFALRKDANPGVHAIAKFFADPWHTRSWERLPECIRTGKPALELAFGVSFFEYLSQHAEESATFFQGMTEFSAMEGPAVADAYDYTRFQSICDVGGGHGSLLALLLDRAPQARGVLFDQPAIIAAAAQIARATFVGGDMFASVPSGIDAYVLKRILHDWPDGRCVEILRHCRAGVNPGGRLLVIEQVILPNEPSTAARLMDLEMLVLLGGEERDESAFRRIFAEAGWRLSRVIPTQSAMFFMEGLPD